MAAEEGGGLVEGRAVREREVRAHLRLSRRDAGGVAEAGGGEPPHQLGAGILGGEHERGGGEEWKVADRGNRVVVLPRLDP